jgi:hypothetical protein
MTPDAGEANLRDVNSLPTDAVNAEALLSKSLSKCALWAALGRFTPPPCGLNNWGRTQMSLLLGAAQMP